MHIRWRIPLATVVLTTWLLFGPSSLWAESLVANGDFQAWTGGAPDDWHLEIGAKNGANEPASEVKMIPGPALMLRGGATTMAWHSVSQPIAARVGQSYRLTFESRTKDIQREGGQYNNCFVGVLMFDQARNVVAQEVQDVSADAGDWIKHQVEFIVPDGVASAKVTIFLSKSGILAVRQVAVTTLETALAGRGQKKGPRVANGDFSQWVDGLPKDWTVGIGANHGADEPQSEIRQIGDAGLALQGSATTMAWQSLSQKLALEPGKMYTLVFEAQAQDIQQQGRQFDNCYVGVMSLDAEGQRVDMAMEDLSQVTPWQQQRVDFRVPTNAATTELLIFLSKSGTLMVKDVHIEEATADRSFRGARR